MNHLRALARVHQNVIAELQPNSRRKKPALLTPTFVHHRGPRRPAKILPVAPRTSSVALDTASIASTSEDRLERLWLQKKAKLDELNELDAQYRRLLHELDEASAMCGVFGRSSDRARADHLALDLIKAKQQLDAWLIQHHKDRNNDA